MRIEQKIGIFGCKIPKQKEAYDYQIHSRNKVLLYKEHETYIFVRLKLRVGLSWWLRSKINRNIKEYRSVRFVVCYKIEGRITCVIYNFF